MIKISSASTRNYVQVLSATSITSYLKDDGTNNQITYPASSSTNSREYSSTYLIYNDNGNFKSVNSLDDTVLFSSVNPSEVILDTLDYLDGRVKDDKARVILRGWFNMSQTIDLRNEHYDDIILVGDRARFYYDGADPFFDLNMDCLYITFQNINFDAGKTVVANRDGAHAIFEANGDVVVGNRQVRFVDCIFEDAKTAALNWSDMDCDGLNVFRCNFRNNRAGVRLNRSSPLNVISDSDFRANNDYSVWSLGGSFWMENCHVHAPIRGNSSHGNTLTERIIIDDCYFEWSGDDPIINVSSMTDWCRVRQLTITNCKFGSIDSPKYHIYAPYIALDNDNTNQASVTITDNKFCHNTAPIAYIYMKRWHAEATIRSNMVEDNIPLINDNDLIEPVAWICKSSENELTFAPSGQVVTIDDILMLQPRTTTPSSPEEGMVYVNDANNHIYCYLGGSWIQLDN
jgi:hypothetical protein